MAAMHLALALIGRFLDWKWQRYEQIRTWEDGTQMLRRVGSNPHSLPIWNMMESFTSSLTMLSDLTGCQEVFRIFENLPEAILFAATLGRNWYSIQVTFTFRCEQIKLSEQCWSLMNSKIWRSTTLCSNLGIPTQPKKGNFFFFYSICPQPLAGT